VPRCAGVDSGPNWTDVAQVIILVAQLAILAIAAVVAWHQVREAKRLREEQARPFVVIDFEVEDAIAFLTVSNLGTTLARNVRFEIEPPLQSSMEIPLDKLKMLGEGISSLAPGKSIRTAFDSLIQRKPLGLPDVYAVTAQYSDETSRRQFQEKLDLDLGVYWNLIRVQRRGEHDIHERLKDIRDELRKWTSGTRGLLRLSPDENRTEQERIMRHFEERSEQQASGGESAGEERDPT
jgi:hypothetical protein